jgi:hypothetical protein
MDNQMVMFQGVVEDRNDPLKVGRVKVRCFGFHTADKNELPTADLPWAHPITPITSASMSEIGQAPVGPVEGTWVIGFFRDGDDAQFPIFFGTVPGIESQGANPQQGFSDPNGKYPLEEGGNCCARICRNEDIENTIVQEKRNNLDSCSCPGKEGETQTRNEPETPYDCQYPFNHVKKTESGHVEEFDDTPGKERIHVYHKSGTFKEIHPDGTTVTKVVKDNYTAILGDETLSIKGNVFVQVVGDASVQVDGDTQLQFGGDVDANIDGKLSVTVANGIEVSGGPSIKQTADRIDLN